MDRAKIVDFYIEKINDKDFSILNVRQELEKNNVDEQEIKVIVRLVDNEIQRRLKNKTTGDSSMELIWFGGIITAAGLIFTIGTYTGIIKMGNYFLLAYGPILGGLSILFYGLGKRK
jgi:hypothetical protein